MPRTHRLPDRLGALAGFAFAVLIFVSVAVVDPLRQATDQELRAWWTESGLLRDSVVSMHLKLGGGACFLVFLAQLRARLHAADPACPWLDLMYGAGIVFVATFSVGAIARGLVAQAVHTGGEPLPGPDTLRYATQSSDVAFGLVAVPFAALTVAAAALTILQTGALPRLLGWLGLVVATLSLIPVALGAGPWATPLLLVWTAGVSTQLLSARGGRPAATEAPPEPPHGDARRHHRHPPPSLPLLPLLPSAPTERRR